MALFNLDPFVACWRMEPVLVEALIDRLPYEPRSRFRVKAQGEELLFGWDARAHLLADLNDNLAGLVNMLAGGGYGYRAPRPFADAPNRVTAERLADLDLAAAFK